MADTVYPARVQKPNFIGLYSWLGADSSCSSRLPSLKFVGDTLSVSTLISMVTLTSDLLTLKLMRFIAHAVGNLSTNFGVSETFRSRLMVQHTIHSDHVTLTFNLGGHGARWWYGSSCSICIPIYKFIGLSVQKIWRTSGLSISRPGVALNLDLEASALYCPWGGQPSYQFWCFWDVSFSTNGPTPVRRSTWPCDLNLWSWRSWRLSVIRVFVLHLHSQFEVRRPSR